jgi:hypothetical protein
MKKKAVVPRKSNKGSSPPAPHRSPVKSSIIRSLVRSPVRSSVKSPVRSPVKSPVRSSIIKSPVRSSIIRSPVKSRGGGWSGLFGSSKKKYQAPSSSTARYTQSSTGLTRPVPINHAPIDHANAMPGYTVASIQKAPSSSTARYTQSPKGINPIPVLPGAGVLDIATTLFKGWGKKGNKRVEREQTGRTRVEQTVIRGTR